MPRLIDADALKEAFFEKGLGYQVIDELIDEAPTIDAVPVVRCKDCVHSYRIDGAKEEYDCRKLSYFSERLPPNHFCSYGERKEWN